MRIHFIIGATGVGKTGLATELARRHEIPVVVLDRFQVFRELSAGTGRPYDHECEGTERIYLCDRSVREGELDLRTAEKLFFHQLEQVAARGPNSSNGIDCIVEGGSISLLRAVFGGIPLRSYRITLAYVPTGEPRKYREKLRERAQGWLNRGDRRALVDEALYVLHAFPEQADFLESIVSYKALVRRAKGTHLVLEGLIDEIVQDVFNYAQAQVALMEEIVARQSPACMPIARLLDKRV
jgi:hypothetical protein